MSSLGAQAMLEFKNNRVKYKKRFKTVDVFIEACYYYLGYEYKV